MAVEEAADIFPGLEPRIRSISRYLLIVPHSVDDVMLSRNIICGAKSFFVGVKTLS